MSESELSPAVSKATAALVKNHARLLEVEENFVATTTGFAPDRAHPEAKRSLFSRGSGNTGPSGGAQLRLQAVREALALGDVGFTELPASPSGYTLALTNDRVLVFDGPAKRYLTETSVEGIWLQEVDHGDGSSTLVFLDGDERVAVTTHREASELTDHFVEAFPDGRDQQRTLQASGQVDVLEF